ncbi:MAG: restriction endonuclease subunit S, partial [Spirochaetota bacterium]
TSQVLRKHGVKGGDILLAVTGPHAGASAIVPLFHGGALPGTGCVGLRAKSETCESFYLLNVLHFLYNSGLIQKEKKNDSLDMETLLDIQLPVPPREIQDSIVSLMLTLSGVMVAQEACIAEAERLQSIIEGG